MLLITLADTPAGGGVIIPKGGLLVWTECDVCARAAKKPIGGGAAGRLVPQRNIKAADVADDVLLACLRGDGENEARDVTGGIGAEADVAR